jgi:heptosyltransferase-3
MTAVPQSILIANIRLIGDVILTTPLIGLLKKAYPEAAIDLLVNRGTGEFLEKDPRVRAVIYSDGIEETGTGQAKSGYLGRVFRRYDLAINMNASDRGNIAVVMAGKKLRVGFYTSGSVMKSLWQRLLLTHPLSFPQDIPVARYCQVVAQALDIPHERLEVKVYWDGGDEARVNSLLEERGVSNPFFVVHPFARWIYKLWDFEKFAAASDAICERYGLQPVWTSSPSPQEKAQLVDAAGRCRHEPILLGGELTLNQMTCLLGRADFYLGLDTAISHLAASTGIPMVALYGPTFTSRWFPWYNNGPSDQQCPPTRGILHRGNIVVLQKEWECVPCGKAGCDDSGTSPSPCIQAFSVDDVLSAVAACLAEANLTSGNARTGSIDE